MTNSQPLLFIVGLPRSGTKLLMNLLNNHSQIFIASELQFLPYLVRRSVEYGPLDQFDNFQQMYADISKTYYFFKWAERGHTPLTAEEWYEKCLAYDLDSVVREFIRSEMGAPENGEVALGDKSPNVIYDMSLMQKGFQDARYIHIVRDVREGALSAKKAWKKNMFRYAQRWNDALAGIDPGLTGNDKRWLEIRYEDLIQNPESVMRRISGFLGIPYSDNLVQLSNPSENLGEATGRTDIVATNTHKYLNELSPAQRRRIEAIAGKMLLKHGYTLEFEPKTIRVSAWKMKSYQYSDAMNRLVFDKQHGRSPAALLKGLCSSLRK